MSSLGTIRSTCRLCYNGCGVKIHMKNGRPVKVSGDDTDSISTGKLCRRGLSLLDVVYHKDRLTHPLKRIGSKGSGRWEKISWNDALDYTADRFKEIRDKYGPKAVAFVRGGSKGLSDDYLVRFANIFGSPNVSSATSVCYTPSFMASMITYGFYAYPDYDHPPACILLWGFNPETTHPPVYQKIRKAIKNGSKIIVIDPAKNRLTGKAEVWLRPKPGTDLALALGMLKVILDEALLDHRFVHDWTIGLDKLKRQLDGLSMERIAELTWINQKLIRKAARVYSAVKPGCISWGNAVETDHHSFQTCRAICMLRALTGNLCIPGSDIKCSDSGELSRRSPLFLQSQNIPDNIRAERLSAKEGLLPQFQHAPHQLLLKSIIDEKPYPIRAAYLQGANLLLSAPDAGKTMEALKKLEFTVAVDFFMTPTTHMVDIILPAATYLEYDSVEQPWHFCTAAVQRKVIQVGEARSSGHILNDLARKLGFQEKVWDDMEMALDEFLKPAGMTFKAFNSIGRLFGPKQYRHYETDGFDTPSGKVELYSRRMKEWGFDALPEYRELTGASGQEPVDTQKFPLILTSRKMKTFYHSCGRQIESLRQVRPQPRVYIHHETAGNLEIEEGDWVSISTQRGTIYQKACPVDWLDPRVVMVEHGWWYPEKGPETCFGWDESNVNVLTGSGKPWNPEVGSARLRGICCRVAKADGHQ